MTLSGDSSRIFRVRLLRGDRVIRTYKIASDSLTIGSAPECTLKLAGDRSLMPKHATLYREDNEVTVVPESGAVVLLNNESVDVGIVEPDDVLKIGKMTFNVALIDAGDSIVPESGRQSRAPKTQVVHGGSMASASGRTVSATAGKKDPDGSQLSSERAPLKGRRSAADETMEYRMDTATPRMPARRPTKKPPTISQDRHSQTLERAAAMPKRPIRPQPENVVVEEVAPPKASVPVNTKPWEDELGHQSDPSLSFDIDVDVALAEALPEETAVPVAAVASEVAASETVLKETDSNAASAATSASTTVSTAPELTFSSFDFSADDYFFDESDEPDDDEFFFAEPFSLTAALSADKSASVEKKSDVPLEPYCAADVVRTTDDRVVEMEYVQPGRKYRAAFDDIRCCSRGKMIEVSTVADSFTTATMAGKTKDLSALPQKRGRVTLLLSPGDSAVLNGTGGKYQIDVYRPPVAPMKSAFGFRSSVFGILGGAIVLHVTVGLLAFAVFPDERQQKEIKEEAEFAVVEMEKPEFKKDEETKPEPKPVEKDATTMAERAPAVSNRAVKRIRERATQAKPSSSVSSLLNVLSRGSGKEGKTNHIKDLVSNIDAVGVGSGSAAYNIAGAIASLPGGDVNVAREGGGGAISTRSGEQVAGKGSKIAELARSKPSGKIRGKVTRMSSGARVKGSLSKEDVSRVVNSHIHAVQACYEKALLRSPGLSGRIVFDWTVKNDGRVSGVRVRSSTLGNSDVSSCISKKIKKWKFPRPKGGEVVITYPFLFRSVSS